MSSTAISLILKITGGPREGDEFKIKDGSVLGRSSGDICLRDPKTSNPHAQIKWDEQASQFMLLDLGSTNKIRFEGKKVDQIALVKDCVFSLGRTQFKVEEDVERSFKSNISDWRQNLLSLLSETKTSSKSMNLEVKAFTQPLLLKAGGEGAQAEAEVSLGYGPRKVGPKSFDLYLNITDIKAPDVCFELHPHDLGVEFKTEFPDLVLLNNQSISSDILKAGDIISLFGQVFEVGYSS